MTDAPFSTGEVGARLIGMEQHITRMAELLQREMPRLIHQSQESEARREILVKLSFYMEQLREQVTETRKTLYGHNGQLGLDDRVRDTEAKVRAILDTLAAHKQLSVAKITAIVGIMQVIITALVGPLLVAWMVNRIQKPPPPPADPPARSKPSQGMSERGPSTVEGRPLNLETGND